MNVTESVLNGVLDGDILAEQRSDVLPQLVAFSFAFAGTLVVASLLVVVVATSPLFSTRKRSKNVDLASVVTAAAAFFAALLVPLAWFLSEARRRAVAAANYVVNNIFFIAGLLLLAAISFFASTYSADVREALLPAWTLGFVPFYYRFVMPPLILVRGGFEVVYPWILGIIIRIPTQTVFGAFFDVGTCSAGAIEVLVERLIMAGLAITPVIPAYTAQADLVLLRPPNFAGFGTELGRALGTGQVFSECLCESVSFVTEPLFLTLEQGDPNKPLDAPGDEDPSTFGQIINSTIAVPWALSIDLARPFVRGIDARQSGLSGAEQYLAAAVSFNQTADAVFNLWRSVIVLQNNLGQQVYMSILRAATDGTRYEVLQVDPGAPPTLLDCPLFISKIFFDAAKFGATFFGKIPETFATFDGQTNWRIRDITDNITRFFDCVCASIAWLGRFLVQIGNVIVGIGQPHIETLTFDDVFASNVNGSAIELTTPFALRTYYIWLAYDDVTFLGSVVQDNLLNVPVILSNESLLPPNSTAVSDEETFLVRLTATLEEALLQDFIVTRVGPVITLTAFTPGPGAGTASNAIIGLDTIVTQEGVAETVLCDADNVTSDAACFFGVVGRFFELVCCAVRAALQWLLALYNTIYETIVLWLYYVITLAIFELGQFNWCITTPIASEYATFCAVPKSPNAGFILDPIAFQAGQRSDRVPFAQCPAAVCALPVCVVDDDCDRYVTDTVATRCDTRYGRCVNDAASCSLGPFSSVPSGCVEGAANMCSLGSCVQRNCLEGDVTEFPCDCECPRSEYRAVANNFLDIFDCIGEFFEKLLGDVGRRIRCFLVNIPRVISEGLLVIVDFLSQLGFFTDDPTSIDVSTQQFRSAIIAVADCIAGSIRAAAEPSTQSAIGPAAFEQSNINLAADMLASFVTTITEGGIDIGAGYQGIFYQIAVVVRTPFVASFIEPLERLLQGIVRVIVSFFYLFGSFFSIFSEVAGEIFKDIADGILDVLFVLVDGILAFLGALGTCLLAILQTYIEFVKCVFQPNPLDALECIFTEGDWIDPLGICLEQIGMLILDLLNFICGDCVDDVLCFIEESGCFFGADRLGICSTLTDSQCDDLNFLCIIEDAMCSIGLPINVGCNKPCGQSLFTCEVAGDICGVESTLITAFTSLNSVPVVSLVPWGLLIEGLYVIVPRPLEECCTTTFSLLGFEYTIIDENYDCAAANFIVTEEVDDNCVIQRTVGCWQYLTPTALAFNQPGCFAPDKKRNIDELSIPNISLPTTAEFVSAMFETYNATDLPLKTMCIPRLMFLADNYPNATWPPLAAIRDSSDLSQARRFQFGMCIDLYRTFDKDSDIQATMRGQTLTPSVYAKMSPEGFSRALFPISFVFGTFKQTIRHISKYAQTSDGVAPTLSLSGAIGAPRLQTSLTDEELAKPCAIAASVVADMLMPFVGPPLRFTRHVVAMARQERELALAKMSSRNTSNLALLVRRATRGFGTAAASISARRHRRAEQRALFPATESESPFWTAFLQREPGPASVVHPYRARPTFLAERRKRETPAARQRIAELAELLAVRRTWQDLANERAFFTSAVALQDDECPQRMSPWECCAEQALCFDCSAVDRFSFVVQDTFRSIGDYYANDYVDRFEPCLRRQTETTYGLQIPADERCPGAAELPQSGECALIECESDADCVASLGPMAPPCNARLHRCVIEGDAQCIGQVGEPCLTVDATVCSLGECSANFTCERDPATDFACDCRCHDTYLTVNKTIPAFTDQFFALEVPCLLNFTCVTDVLFDDFDFSQIDTNNAFRGSFVQRKLANSPDGRNFDLFLLDAIGAVIPGFNDTLIVFFEDTAFRASVLQDALAFDRFLDTFIFCDYDAGWFCPLEGESTAPTCCSDECEVRRRGTTLVNGVVWVVLVLGIPLALFACIPACQIFTPFLIVVWFIVAYALSMHFAYGGAILCYTQGLGFAVVPLYTLVVRFGLALLRFTAFIVNFVFCGILPSGDVATRVCSRFCMGVAVVFAALTVFPGASMCLGMDVFNVAQQLVSPCGYVNPVLVNRSMPGATTPCGTLVSSDLYVAPTLIRCVSTPALAPTRFSDVLDPAFYLVNRFDPELVERWAQSSAPLISKYASAHTTAAHDAAQPLTDACFAETAFPGVVVGLAAVAILAALTASDFVYALLQIAFIATPLFLAAYAVWKAFDIVINVGALGVTDDGREEPPDDFVGDDVDAEALSGAKKKM